MARKKVVDAEPLELVESDDPQREDESDEDYAARMVKNGPEPIDTRVSASSVEGGE